MVAFRPVADTVDGGLQPVGQITGSLVLRVDAPASFAQDPRVKAPIAAAIASGLPGVGADMVRIGSIEAVRRRLRGERRLQLLPVRVPYTILTGSAEAASDVVASMEMV